MTDHSTNPHDFTPAEPKAERTCPMTDEQMNAKAAAWRARNDVLSAPAESERRRDGFAEDLRTIAGGGAVQPSVLRGAADIIDHAESERGESVVTFSCDQPHNPHVFVNGKCIGPFTSIPAGGWTYYTAAQPTAAAGEGGVVDAMWCRLKRNGNEHQFDEDGICRCGADYGSVIEAYKELHARLAAPSSPPQADAPDDPVIREMLGALAESANCAVCEDIGRHWNGPGICEAHAAKVAAMRQRLMDTLVAIRTGRRPPPADAEADERAMEAIRFAILRCEDTYRDEARLYSRGRDDLAQEILPTLRAALRYRAGDRR